MIHEHRVYRVIDVESSQDRWIVVHRGGLVIGAGQPFSPRSQIEVDVVFGEVKGQGVFDGTIARSICPMCHENALSQLRHNWMLKVKVV